MTMSSELGSVSNAIIVDWKNRKEVIKNLSVLVGIRTGCFTNKSHICYYLRGLTYRTAEREEREDV